MNSTTESVRLRVVTSNVRLPNVSVSVPKGEYEGHIDWQNECESDGHMTAVQLMIDQDRLAKMGRSDGIPSMQREVLKYLKSGDIERVE
jgi:hypothetical protein